MTLLTEILDCVRLSMFSCWFSASFLHVQCCELFSQQNTFPVPLLPRCSLANWRCTAVREHSALLLICLAKKLFKLLISDAEGKKEKRRCQFWTECIRFASVLSYSLLYISCSWMVFQRLVARSDPHNMVHTNRNSTQQVHILYTKLKWKALRGKTSGGAVERCYEHRTVTTHLQRQVQRSDLNTEGGVSLTEM